MHSAPIPKRYDASMNALSSRQIARSIVRYGIKPAVIAVYFVLLALLWTFPLQPLIAYPFVFLFFGAIVCSAWFGGFLAGLWAIAMSYVLLAFFVFAPLYSIAVGKESRTYVVAYIVCAIAITVVSVARRSAQPNRSAPIGRFLNASAICGV